MMKMIFPIITFIFLKFNLLNMIIMLSTIMILLMLTHNLTYMLNSLILIDSLSILMLLLTFISTLMIILSSFTLHKIFLTISPIMILLTLTFSFSNMINFYIMFELVLIPTMMLIMMNGKQPERLQASIYLLLYTITASLPLLMSIIYMKNLSFFYLTITMMKFQLPIILMLAFLVKMPMFFFHLWLPKAHVEAPLEGSMILAAILLKLGGYGLIRFLPMCTKKANMMNHWIISISLIGASATGLNCIRQKDLKSLIAYSSVSHMGMVLLGIFTFNTMGLYGAIIMMIAHGLSSSALFLLSNDIYMKYHTRNILMFKGIISMSPNISFWWFIYMAINISAPPTINTLSEIMLMSSLINWNILSIIILFVLSITTTSFSMMMFLNLNHNKNYLLPSLQTSPKIFMSLFSHSLPLIMMLFKMEMFI